MSALGDGRGIFEEIRAVEELRMVGRDTVVVGGPLPVRDDVLAIRSLGLGATTVQVIILDAAVSFAHNTDNVSYCFRDTCDSCDSQ